MYNFLDLSEPKPSDQLRPETVLQTNMDLCAGGTLRNLRGLI